MITLVLGLITYSLVLKGQFNSAQRQRLGIKIFSSDYRAESAT